MSAARENVFVHELAGRECEESLHIHLYINPLIADF